MADPWSPRSLPPRLFVAVVALLNDVSARLRLADALKGRAVAIACVSDAAAVRARLGVGGVRALVVGPRDTAERSTAPLVEEVRRAHPGVTVVAYCGAGAGASADIVALVQAGAHALVVRGVDDERHAFRAALRDAEQRSVVALVLERVGGAIPDGVAPLVAVYLRADGVPPTVTEAAALLGVHRKTLVNRMAAAGCPPPRALRTWCRLFLVGRLLEDPGRTVESIALQLEFDSATGLRNALKRYTGSPAQAVRAGGGLACVLAHFDAVCAGRRARAARAAGAAAVGPVDATGGGDAMPAGEAAGSGAPGTRRGAAVRAWGRRPAALAATRVLAAAGALWLEYGGADLLSLAA